jgi:hypothetical protein
MSSPIARVALCLVLLISAPAAVQAGALQSQSPAGLPQSAYFEVTRPDLRLCPSPLCGGYFVRLVNRARLQCADGTVARECHAAQIDWSALGLAPDDEARLMAEFGDKRVLVRGQLVEQDSGFGISIPTLVATDAWRGVVAPKDSRDLLSWKRPSRDRYFGVEPSGIVCVTYPCPSLVQLWLNSNIVRELHDIDLGQSGATPEQIAAGLDALYQGDGLLVLGRNRLFSGPAGTGQRLVAQNFYIKVASGSQPPQACGGFTYPPNPACPTGEFCELPAGTCWIADLPGICATVPEVCPLFVDPVCGCDGVTYGNDCERLQAEVALDHAGACDSGKACGDGTCAPGTVCCNPVQGICTPPGFVCAQ